MNKHSTAVQKKLEQKTDKLTVVGVGRIQTGKKSPWRFKVG